MLIGISISLLKLATYALSLFSIRPFNTWIKVILNVPPAAPSIWATFGSLALSVRKSSVCALVSLVMSCCLSGAG